MFHRQQHSKMVTNSLIMIYLFYIILAAVSRGFYFLFYEGWSVYQILLIPIVLGFSGLSWGLYNLTFDPAVKWDYAKKSAYFIIAGVVAILLSTVFIIFSYYLDNETAKDVLRIMGSILLILTAPLNSIGFFILRLDLKPHYFNKYIFKFPNIYTSIAYLVQTIGLTFLFTSTFFEGTSIFTIFFLIGLIANIISIIGLGVGYYPIFISFRTYPKILEILEEEQLKKQQTSSPKKTKKAT